MGRFYSAMRKLLAIPLLKTVIRGEFYGLENIPQDKGFILCCNHVSMTDPVLLVAKIKNQIYFMSKKEAFKFPVLGPIIKRMGAIDVDREANDKTAVVRSIEVVKKGGILGIFPEGTRNKEPGTPPKKAKAGAAFIALQTGADILPVAIYRKNKFRLFSKAKVNFGQPIKFEDLPNSSNLKRDMVNTTHLIMDRITELWEEMK